MAPTVDWTVAALVASNIFFSIGVILANKHLFQDLAFKYSATLTGLHFVATTGFSYALHGMKWEVHNPLDTRTTVILSVATCISIWFQNFSLLLNTVDFYQVTKLAVIPCTVLLQWLLYQTGTSTPIKGALTILTVGVGVATVSAIDVNASGLAVALIGVLTTSFQQIIYSMFMKDRKMNGVQLYYNIGPLSACLMIGGGLIVDTVLQHGVSIFEVAYTPSIITWILISCSLAAPMNFSSAMMLAKTSAVTYQVVGHTKTIIIWLLGVLVFTSTVTTNSIIGFVIAMVGVVWYTQLRMNESPPKPPAPTGPTAPPAYPSDSTAVHIAGDKGTTTDREAEP